MPDLKNKFRKISKSYIQIAGILFLLLLAVVFLWFNKITSTQAIPALVAQVYFDGEYRIADGEWQKIVKGEHIPSTKGDVLLRGNFHMLAPDGEYVGIYRGDIPIAFHTDHINLRFFEEGNEFLVIETEDPLYGKSVCGENWTACFFTGESERTIEILVHNPHNFGNETAIDEMLSGIALWTGIDFEKNVMSSGETQRNFGMMLMLVSIVLLGIALFSSLIHIKNNQIIWLLGALVLFAGAYVAYSADGVSFWHDSIVSNTTILGFSMMFYMLFLSIIIVCLLKKTRKIGHCLILHLGVAIAVFLVIPVITDVYFYDTWIWWIAIQLVVNFVFTACLIKEFITLNKRERWFCIGVFLPLLAFAVDVSGTWRGIWKGGLLSQCVFIILFAAAMIMVLKLIPSSINAAAKAKKLEMERMVLNAQLSESRVATMMSQIRPHFIYNTLGSIEQLCKLDPPKAGDLVHNFAKYLRGNFGELDNPKPILMSQEMEHVHHYINIEMCVFRT